MTGKEVYESACSILFEKPGQDMAFYNSALSLINLLIAEAIPYQNNRNRAEGKEEIDVFRIKTLDDEIALDSPIVSLALPYGLASYFYQDETDNFLSQEYRNRFIVALEECKKCTMDDISDEYSSGEE